MRIAAADYERLKAFFAWTTANLFPPGPTLPPDQYPLAVLNRTEARSPSNARAGLAMAIGDIIEMSEGFAAGQVAAIDAALEAEGIITLSAVRARFWSRIRRVLERGTIRGERDYHAVRNVVEALPEEEQERAWRLLAAFEEKAARKGK
ncbi:MAG: hypothetical protein JO276_06965 [Sphingomonadaceae bacterium]|nr:hypothetical protein [Sphingomonadaceae bacterium]